MTRYVGDVLVRYLVQRAELESDAQPCSQGVKRQLAVVDGVCRNAAKVALAKVCVAVFQASGYSVSECLLDASTCRPAMSYIIVRRKRREAWSNSLCDLNVAEGPTRRCIK